MRPDQLGRYINQLASSGRVQSHTANFGVGAKVAAGSRNPHGLEYRSWHQGHGALVRFKRHRDGRWGLEPQRWPDGRRDYWRPLEEQDKPWLLLGQDHGTQVVLLGRHERDDTTQAPESVTDARPHWITRYLNSRFRQFPDDIEVLVREHHGRTQAGQLTPAQGERAHVERRAVCGDTARTMLLLDHEPLPWARWGDEFAAAMPEEIRRLQEHAASTDATPRQDAIRSRVASILPLYRLSRYRPTQPPRPSAATGDRDAPPTRTPRAKVAAPTTRPSKDADRIITDDAPSPNPADGEPPADDSNRDDGADTIVDLPDVAWISAHRPLARPVHRDPRRPRGHRSPGPRMVRASSDRGRPGRPKLELARGAARRAALADLVHRRPAFNHVRNEHADVDVQRIVQDVVMEHICGRARFHEDDAGVAAPMRRELALMQHRAPEATAILSGEVLTAQRALQIRSRNRSLAVIAPRTAPGASPGASRCGKRQRTPACRTPRAIARATTSAARTSTAS
jgi:hypothetical protein